MLSAARFVSKIIDLHGGIGIGRQLSSLMQNVSTIPSSLYICVF